MCKKKSKTHQSSNAGVNPDSSDSNDVNGKPAPSNACPHIAKSVDPTQVSKILKNCEDLKKNFCPICIKDSKPLKGSEIYVCLKCGTKTCCKEHSQAHFNIPHSDLHALAYDVTSQIVWCYGCPCEINETEVQVRKLSACISCVTRQMCLAQKEKFVNIKLPDTNDDNKENVKDSNNKAQGFGKNGKKGGKPGILSQSALSLAPVRGLSNLGNTCYFNSVMQCLARTQSLLCELIEMDHEIDIRLELKGGETLKGSLCKWDQMSECLYETLSSLLAPGSAYVPLKFLNFVRKRHPQFEGYDQHDAHELLRHTLDSIKMNDLKRYHRIMLEQKGLLKADPKGVPQEVQKQMKELEHKVTQVQTFIPEKTFKGRLVSRVECQECHHSSEYIEGFLDLSLPILADKPHPPVGRRKGGNSQDDLPIDATETQIGSKVISKKQMRLLKKRALKASAVEPQSRADTHGCLDEVAAEAHEALAVKEEVPRALEEEKPHESGYSSEKASSSLRGSPSSEEVRSSSPCDDSWSTLPQFTDSLLNALPDGALQLLTHVKDTSPSLVDRPSTKISFLPNGIPNLAHLSLHDSVGSTLNRLCENTQAIMDQEPDWRSRIHQEPSRWMQFSLSFESGNSLEELTQNDDTSLVKSSQLLDVHEDSPSSAVLRDGKEGWTRNGGGKFYSNDSNEPSVGATAPGNAALPTSQITEGHKKLSLGDLGRSVSPPLRKMWTPHLKRDSDFSPLKEEECDASVMEVLPPAEDVANVISDDTNAPKELNGGVAPRRGSPVFMQKFSSAPADSLAVSDLDKLKEADIYKSEERSQKESVESDPWPSFRESFTCSKDTGSALGRENYAEGNPEAAHNNSLDSNSNASEDEHFMPGESFLPLPIISGELPVGEFVYEDSSIDSPIKHSLPLPDPSASGEELQMTLAQKSRSSEEGDLEPLPLLDPLASGDELQMTLAQKSRSSDEGDFDPLLGTLPETPKIPYVAQEDVKKEEYADSVSRNNNSKIPCPVKKKDYRDNRDTCECSVESCLRQFTSIEFMTGSNKVGCSACTDRQNKGAKDGKTVLTMATKQLLIGQAPPVLILHLKRFQVQLHSVRKLTKHVSFPLILDLDPFCTSIGEDKNKLSDDLPMLYSLYGIVEHRGTLHSGHYVAYVKVEEADKKRWFCISDSHIDEVTEERVLKTEAYLLFYSKITLPSSSS